MYTWFLHTPRYQKSETFLRRGTTGSAGNTALAVSVAESWLEEIQLGKTIPFMGEYHWNMSIFLPLKMIFL